MLVDPSGHSACMDCYGGGIGPEVIAAAGASLLSQAGQALNVAVADGQAFLQSLAQQFGNQIPAVADQFANAGQASQPTSSNAGNTAGPGGLDPNDPRFRELLDQAAQQSADTTCPGCKTANPELLRGRGAIATRQHVMNPGDIGKDGISAWCQGCGSNLPPKFWGHSIEDIQRFAEQIGLDPAKAAVYTPQYGRTGHYSLFIDAIGADGYILPQYAELIDVFLRSMR